MITRNAAHQYTDTSTGTVYPGVTGILSRLGANFEVAANYGAKQVAMRVYELMGRGDALRAMYETLGAQGFIPGLASAGRKHRDEAAQLGTEVHNLADLVVRGQPTPSMTETQRERVLHYAKWWETQLAAGVKLRLSEAMVLKPHGEGDAIGWGGTFDLLYYDPDGRTVLADIKTGKAVYREAVLQLAAYGMASLVQPQRPLIDALNPNVSPGEWVYPMPLPDRYQVIHVTGEGVREVEINVGTAERMAFLACLDLWHWMEGMKGKRL